MARPQERQSSVSSRVFKETTHLIPTPGEGQQRPPRYEPFQFKWWLAGSAVLFTLLLGVGLEVALFESNQLGGFSVPEKNVFSFASTQSLTSFFPILVVAPLALWWESSGWMMRRYQPYLNLARGDATAEDTLLLDYISMNQFAVLWSSFRRRHWVVNLAVMLRLATFLLQPLAGSIFNVIQSPTTEPTTALSTKILGLDPNLFGLDAFLAGAGYVQAAVVNNLPDPPFINGSWAVADFQPPAEFYLNGTIAVNTVGIRTEVNCSAPDSVSLSTPTSGTFQITAVSSVGCSVNVSFDASNGNQQYGTINVPQCGPTADANASFQPAFFWFFHLNEQSNQPEARGVFCQPIIGVFDVLASIDTSSMSMSNVSITGEINTQNSQNNVTGPPLSGLAFNGLIIDDPNTNAFIQSQATALRSVVPGAIFRAALQLPGDGLQTTFDEQDGFLNITNKVYTQHMSIVAKATYFLPTEQILAANVTSLEPRLTIEHFPAHFLSVLLILTSIIGGFLHVVHYRARRTVWLAAQPGSLASAVSLTSHSGFGQLLVPYDTEDSVRAKLNGLRFRLDKRTGAIVARDAELDDPKIEALGLEEFRVSLMTDKDLRTPGSGSSAEGWPTSPPVSEGWPTSPPVSEA